MYLKCGYGVMVTSHLPKVLLRVRVSLAALFIFIKALRAYFFAYFRRSAQRKIQRILCI
jgi:hypothetical protein